MSTALVFPGQGSQAVGMLADLAAQDSTVTEVYQQASDALGYDLWQVCQDGPKEKLGETQITQPALLAAGYAVWRVLANTGSVKPAFLAGHSLGEYTALVCAGAIDFAEAVKLVAERGRLMQEAVPAGVGAMAAILGLEDQQVLDVCEAAKENQVVSAVNFNSPGQVVIAGNKEAVDRAMALAKEKGAKRALPLPVSVPSHCMLMKPAAEKMQSVLADISINAPQIPVVHNYDVKAHSDPAEIRDALVNQLFNPVLWVSTIEYFGQQGVDQLIECGPGKVLVGLNRRINKDMQASAVYDPATLDAATQALGVES